MQKEHLSTGQEHHKPLLHLFGRRRGCFEEFGGHKGSCGRWRKFDDRHDVLQKRSLLGCRVHDIH